MALFVYKFFFFKLILQSQFNNVKTKYNQNDRRVKMLKYVSEKLIQLVMRKL